jgi:hypothetical protein
MVNMRYIDQHCVDTLVNSSTSETGVRKILCFFLVNPAVKIISTAHVTNTNWLRLLPAAIRTLTPLFPFAVPMTIIHIICEYTTVGMTHREALAVRADLMNERKYFMGAHSALWERDYSLCEH